MDRIALPSDQHTWRGLPALSERELHRRRELVFLILAGLFLGTLAMLNIIGITRFLDFSVTIPGTDREVPLRVAVGVLPYPITFLCTDFISELYGRRRANQVVFVGLGLNLWVVLILWLGAALPGSDDSLLGDIRDHAFMAVNASMIAYLFAQLIDVQLFHFWKRLTRGRHLWLRNNGSTLVSQLVDTTTVILITHAQFPKALGLSADRSATAQLMELIAAGYVFKLVVALADTAPFYLGTAWFLRYLRLAPAAQPAADGGT